MCDNVHPDVGTYRCASCMQRFIYPRTHTAPEPSPRRAYWLDYANYQRAAFLACCPRCWILHNTAWMDAVDEAAEIEWEP